LAGFSVIAAIGVSGCGDGGGSGLPEAGSPAYTQEEAITVWQGKVFEGRDKENAIVDCGKAQTLTGTDPKYDYLYFPDRKVTFIINKESKVIERIEKGRVTE